MAVRETLLDLKKFRVGGTKSQPEYYQNVRVSNNKIYQNVESIYRKNVNQNLRELTPYLTSPIKKDTNVFLSANNIDYNKLNAYAAKKTLPTIEFPSFLESIKDNIIPDFIAKHVSYKKHITTHKHHVELPLKKKYVELLKNNNARKENLLFVWEAFPQFSLNDIFMTLDAFEWSIEKSVEWLNEHKTPPMKNLSQDELRDFLEESDDEYMEYDDSLDRFARAEFDIEEYSFIMDYGIANPNFPPLYNNNQNVPTSNNNTMLNNPSGGPPGSYHGSHINNNNNMMGGSAYHQSNHPTSTGRLPLLNTGTMSTGLSNNPSIKRIQINNSNLVSSSELNSSRNLDQTNKRKRVPATGEDYNGINESSLQIALDNPETDFSNTVERFNNFTQQRNKQFHHYHGSNSSSTNIQESLSALASNTITTSNHHRLSNISGSSSLGTSGLYGSEKESLVDFFNNSTKEELLTLKHCTLKKYETVIQQRPFRSYEELSAKCERFKFLGVELLQSAKKMLYVRKQIIKVLQHCEQLSNNLQKAVENMMARGTMVVQPSMSVAHSYSLKPYQIAGINWLNLLHKMNMNAILADEMGLGKTVQVLAFLQYLLETGIRGPILIVVPASTLENWTNEIAIWCPVSRITIYYGSQNERKDQRFFLVEEKGIEQLDIILTTYAMISSTTDDKNFFKRILFTYVIFDEAHMLKNMASLRYKFLMKLKSKFRILMTGTPIQNNLMELMSLLQFVLPEHIFEDKNEELKTVFSAYESPNSRGFKENSTEFANSPSSELDPVDSEDTIIGTNGNPKKRLSVDRRPKSQFEIERIEQAKRIVRPFVLRRTKAQVLDQLPPKLHEITSCDMTFEQNELYQRTLNDYKEQLINSTSVLPPMNIMMKLRKVANHPLLVRSLYTDELLDQMSHSMINEPTHKHALPHLILSDMKVLTDFELFKLTKAFKSIAGFRLPNETIVSSGKMRELDKLLPGIVEKNEKALIFSQFTLMLDVLGEYLTIKNYKYLRIDGSTPVPERLTLIKNFSTDKECPFFLLSTKAGGLGINLTSANHVIIHDIDINPYNDKQAEDRCHRVGQDKVVSVNRLISKDTIEEVILKCSEEKLKLEVSMTGSSIANGLILGGTDVFEGENPIQQEDMSEDIANLLKLAIAS